MWSWSGRGGADSLEYGLPSLLEEYRHPGSAIIIFLFFVLVIVSRKTLFIDEVHHVADLGGTGAPEAGLPGEGGKVPLLSREADFSLELDVRRHEPC